METMKRLTMVRHRSARLTLLLKVYGARMQRAEESFNLWLHGVQSADEREQHWSDYQWQSERASVAFSRHSRLARRIIMGE